MTWSTIGFEPQKRYFSDILKKNRLLHAYLFSGPEMIGKKRFVNELYRFANPASSDSFDADLMVVGPRVNEGESKIYIDDIREVNMFLSRKPLVGPYKFVIIDEADQLTLEASNALLKILEEPPSYGVLVLVSSQSKQLLPTIASRCQEFQFLPHSRETIKKGLASKKSAPSIAELITEISGGRLGWAIKIVESGLAEDIQSAIRDFQKLPTQGVAQRLGYAKKLYEKETYVPTVDYWLRWAHAHLIDLQNSSHALRGLLKLHYAISQPQYSHRLALERFLLDLA